jgi:glycosyltransferase involved in cell wall biosynthesis
MKNNTSPLHRMNKRIEIIIPCYNEEINLTALIAEIDKYTLTLDYDFLIFFVDDGSTDNTYNVLDSLAKQQPRISVIRLARNFGKEAAIAAGLQHSDADAAIIMDADLQHPPALIPLLIAEWEKGANVVDAVKTVRQKDNIINHLLSLSFYKIMSYLTKIDYYGSSDFKLLDKRVIAVLNQVNEKSRFFRGITNWIGFDHAKITFDVNIRNAGRSKFTFQKLFQLSFDAITSFSSQLLHVITILGLLTLGFSVILGLQTLYNKFFGDAVSGFTTVILIILFLSSILMISIGILGLYLSKIFYEVKNRPIFIIDKYNTSDKSSES